MTPDDGQQKPPTGFPEPAGKDPGDRSQDPNPHHALSSPADNPDPTEWPDPYDDREDPRDPVDPDGAPFGEQPHVRSGVTSTSEPYPAQDPQAEPWEGLKRDEVDE